MLLFSSGCLLVCQSLLSSSLYCDWLMDELSSHSHFLMFCNLTAGHPTVQGTKLVRGGWQPVTTLFTFFSDWDPLPHRHKHRDLGKKWVNDSSLIFHPPWQSFFLKTSFLCRNDLEKNMESQSWVARIREGTQDILEGSGTDQKRYSASRWGLEQGRWDAGRTKFHQQAG